jgi:hypothetical protein
MGSPFVTFIYVLTNINFIPVPQIYHLYGSVFITLVPIISDETKGKTRILPVSYFNSKQKRKIRIV